MTPEEQCPRCGHPGQHLINRPCGEQWTEAGWIMTCGCIG